MIDRLAYLFYRSLSVFAGQLPIALCSRLGAFLGWLGYLALPSYRKLARRNLGIAFPSSQPAELSRLTRLHFTTLGANLLSSLKIAELPAEKLRNIVTVEGEEIAAKLVADKRGIVVVISHIGNWELFAQIWPVIFRCPSGTVYQRLGNPHIDGAVRRNRARLGLHLFERKEGFQGAMQLLRQGGSVGVLVDQHAGDAGVWCPFFGRLASTSSLAATLASRTGAAMVPAAVYSDGPGRWRMVIQPPLEPTTRDAGQITALINRTLEQQIRRQPADWFWVHNRWKTPRPKLLLATYKRGIVPNIDPANPLQPFKIVIRSSNWLGDAVMTVPAVRAIKRGRPDAHVAILSPAKLAEFWKSIPEVDEIIAIESKDSVFGVAAKLRGKFEVAVILPNSLRTGLEAFLAGIPRRVGYPGHRRTALLNQVFREKKKKKAQRPTHQVHHYLALAEFIGADLEDVEIESSPASIKAKNRPPVLGLCPGAEYGPAKRWLPERFADVMRELQQRYQAQWKVFGVAKDRPVADLILARAGTGEDWVGKTSLAELIAQLRQCDLLLTNDTGTMHLAASLGIPVAAIFGSTEPALTGPLGHGHRILRHHVECSPCFLRECPLDFRCMTSIGVAETVQTVEEMLGLCTPAVPDPTQPLNLHS